MRTSSATDFASILRMTCPRWTFTVTRLSPSSAAICLFTRPATTKLHDLPLALRELVVTRLQRREARRVAAPCAIALDGRMDRIEQHLIVERLGEELGRAGLHRTDGHRNVAVPADEDDRNSHTCLSRALPETSSPLMPGSRTSSTRQPGASGRFACMNSWAEEKRRASRPTDLRRVLKRAAHGWIVVDDEDYCGLAHGILRRLRHRRRQLILRNDEGRSPALASAE